MCVECKFCREILINSSGNFLIIKKLMLLDRRFSGSLNMLEFCSFVLWILNVFPLAHFSLHFAPSQSSERSHSKIFIFFLLLNEMKSVRKRIFWPFTSSRVVLQIYLEFSLLNESFFDFEWEKLIKFTKIYKFINKKWKFNQKFIKKVRKSW